MALTALLAFAVPLLWDWWLQFPPATGSATTDAKLRELSEYVGSWWIPTWPLDPLRQQQSSYYQRCRRLAQKSHYSLWNAAPVTTRFTALAAKIQSCCIQLVAGRPAKQQLLTYVEVNSDLWNAKVRYVMDIGPIFASPAADVNAVHYSRM